MIDSRLFCWRPLGRAAIVLAAAALFTVASAQAQGRGRGKSGPPGGNSQQRMQTVGEWVEFEVKSDVEFPTRALKPVLRIGEHEFSRSRYPSDGRQDTLIFRIPKTDFEKLSAKDEVTVFYALSPPRVTPGGERIKAQPEARGAGWGFGKLKKEMLDQPSPPDGEPE